jgi:hypothetical protein
MMVIIVGDGRDRHKGAFRVLLEGNDLAAKAEVAC